MKTLIAAILMLSLIACMAVVGPFETMTFAWEKAPSHGTNIVFRLKYGTSTNSYPWFVDVGTNTMATVTNATSGFLYFIVVARTTDGLESDPSNLVNVTNYPAAPLRLRIETNTTSSVIIEGIMDGITDWKPLAVVTSDPVAIVGARKGMMFRAKVVLPSPKRYDEK